MELPLKEIQLEGFKSFRDRTALKFDGSFTAVVGPNGSGKSNMVDAVKWVLGDHSPRSIRASTSLDAIYRPVEGNGGEPSGYCAVLIKIDNSESQAGDEPTEWDIERRYYRSGESVYSINGKPARLRDVRALMASKGFGLGSLSVVGQGEIDGFLSLVPVDRRLVFEDLARISDFKVNKRKILGQLEDSARNDERLRDLIGEISVRADVLTTQASDARRHAELSEAEEEVRSQLAAQEYLLARRNVERNESRLKESQESLAQARDDLKSKVQAVTDAKQTLENGRKESASTLTECGKVRRELDRARAEERRLTEAGGHFSTLIATLEGELSDRERRIGKIRDRLTELEEIESAAGIERARADRDRLDYALYLSRRWGYMRACERERERLQSKVERLAGEGSLFARDVEFHNRRAEAVQSEIGKLEEEKKGLLAEVNAREVGGIEFKREIERLEKLAGKSGTAIEEIDGEVRSLDSQRERVEGRKHGVEAEVAGFEREESLLMELEASREGYADAVRAILNRKDEFPGLKGTVGELVEVQPGYEEVVERVLGDSLGFLVVDTVEQALRIVEAARSENLGSLTIVVLDLVPKSVTGKANGELANSCRTSPELQNFLNLVFPGARRVESLKDFTPENLHGMLITSDGTVFRPPAFVSGGSKGPVADGILTRRGRIREVGRTIARKKSEIIGIQWEIARLGAEMEIRGKLRKSEQHVLVSLVDSLKQAEEARKSNVEALERAVTDLSGIDNRLVELAGEHAGYLESARLAAMGAQAMKRARADAETDLESLEKELPALPRQVEDLRSRLQRAIVEEASYREEAERARSENARLAGEIAGAMDEVTARRKKLDEIRGEAKSRSEELRSASENRETLERVLPGLEEKESTASDLIGKLTQAVTDAENALEDARGEIERLEDDVHSQDVRLAELRGALTGLDRELDEYPQFAARVRSGEMAGKDIPSRKELTEKLAMLVAELEELGDVNPLAIQEEISARERLEELRNERQDLLEAEEELRKALEEIERESQRAFVETFEASQVKFAEVFSSLFPGGSGELKLTEPDNPLESGIDVKVRFPGKGELDLLQFSGGERALIALALLFAILKVKPSSFTLLDEVEASLDDVNTQKFLDYLGKEFPERQFVFITHNKITMERADRLYGVTMRESGVSQVVSVDLRRLQDEGIDEVLGGPN